MHTDNKLVFRVLDWAQSHIDSKGTYFWVAMPGILLIILFSHSRLNTCIHLIGFIYAFWTVKQSKYCNKEAEITETIHFNGLFLVLILHHLN